MVSEDLVDRVIEMRRLLDGAAAEQARLGRDPEEGIRIAIPDHPDWWLQLVPLPTSAQMLSKCAEFREESELGPPEAIAADRPLDLWEVQEVGQMPPPLSRQIRPLTCAPAAEIPVVVEREYRRLLLERRNAACGTPTRTFG